MNKKKQMTEKQYSENNMNEKKHMNKKKNRWTERMYSKTTYV